MGSKALERRLRAVPLRGISLLLSSELVFFAQFHRQPQDTYYIFYHATVNT
jgi:hypothetical protein